MTALIDITGQTFGRLTAIERAGSRGNHALWRCRCSCGQEAIVIGKLLRIGHTKSCGCWRSDNWFIQKQTHGDSRTRLYRIWSGMRNRCANPNNQAFDHYGGRGIRVCAEWQQFEPFRDWALANGYTDDLTIDRIENDGHYEPNNCRWATYAQQGRNQPQNRAVIRSDGKRFALIIDAAREMGCSHSGISAACRGKVKTFAGYGWQYAQNISGAV
jgi:hypothetical protein